MCIVSVLQDPQVEAWIFFLDSGTVDQAAGEKMRYFEKSYDVKPTASSCTGRTIVFGGASLHREPAWLRTTEGTTSTHLPYNKDDILTVHVFSNKSAAHRASVKSLGGSGAPDMLRAVIQTLLVLDANKVLRNSLFVREMLRRASGGRCPRICQGVITTHGRRSCNNGY